MAGDGSDSTKPVGRANENERAIPFCPAGSTGLRRLEELGMNGNSLRTPSSQEHAPRQNDTRELFTGGVNWQSTSGKEALAFPVRLHVPSR